MVAAFDYCLHGKGGAAPSIDTAMHGLVDAAHVDHLHPDSGHRDRHRRRRRGADQEDLRRQGGLGAVAPPRLPAGPRHRRDQGRQPAGDRLHPRRPRHHRVGRHLRGVPRPTRCGSSTPPRPTSPSTARPSRSAPPLDGYARAARGRAPGEGRRPGADPARHRLARQADGRPLHRRRRGARLPRLAPSTRGWPRWARSCPDHFLRTKVKPLRARPARRRTASRSRSRG